MVRKSIVITLIALVTISCQKESDFTLNGKVNGLKKGTLYLQKVEDTTLINLDSVAIDGDPEFTLETMLKEPQILYLNLEKVDASDYDDRIILFAEPGEMTVTTSLKNFVGQAAITGSKNQLKLDEYQKIMNRFNDQNLDLIKKSFEAQQHNQEDSIIEFDKQLENLVKRKYLYTVNFALNNKEMEVAPYVALSEIFDANIKYLDTIYSSLAPKVRRSKYGKSLKDFIAERKEQEKTAAQETEIKTVDETTVEE